MKGEPILLLDLQFLIKSFELLVYFYLMTLIYAYSFVCSVS